MPANMRLRSSRPFNIEDVEAPFSQAFSASFDNTFTAGRELYGYISRNFREFNDKQLGRVSTKYLSQDEAKERIGNLPLEVNERISEDRLNNLIESKKKELYNQSIISRADDGMLTQLGLFGAGFAATLSDPLELALSGIPVVSQAKYSVMLERAGSNAMARAGVRAKVGAAGGVVGAAISEPFIQIGASDRQADYTMYDSLTNLVFGGLVGGGLHLGGGVIKDKFFKPTGTAKIIDEVSSETRMSALNTAMKQMNEGYAVNVDHILKSDPRYIYSTGKAVNDVPESVSKKKSFDRATEESVRIYNDVLTKSVDEIKAELSIKDMPNKSMAKLSDIDSKIKNIDEKLNEPGIKNKEKLASDREELVRERNSISSAIKSKELSKKLDEIISNPEKFDVNDYPPELRAKVDRKLKEVHKQRSPELVMNLVNDYKTNKINKSDYVPDEHELQKINRDYELSKMSDEANDLLMDDAIESMRAEAELLGIKDDINLIDDTVKKMEQEADELDKALKEFSLCKVING